VTDRLAGTSAETPKGLRFSPGEAHLLIWSLAALGVGLLAWMKTLSPGRAVPAEPPRKTVSADIFEPYKILAAPPPAKPAPARSMPAPKKRTLPPAEGVYEVELD
jgi:hypothetical protein